MQDKKQPLEPYMEQQIGSNLGKEYVKVVYCHHAYFTYIQSISWEIPCCMTQSQNQDSWEKYQQPEICRWYHFNGRKWRGTKQPIDEGEKEWKSWLKTQYSNKEDNGILSQHVIVNRWGKSGNWCILFSWAPKLLQTVTAATKLKDTCSFEEELWRT